MCELEKKIVIKAEMAGIEYGDWSYGKTKWHVKARTNAV
jgi:hypothetical protein